MAHKQDLIAKLEDRSAVIGVVGLGYVGLPLALRYASIGYQVVGFDIDPEKARAIAAGESYIKHIPAADIAAVAGGALRATTDFAEASAVDALILCVPTPLGKHREPDLRYVTETCHALAPHVRPGQVVSLESTTYPGTTDEEVAPIFAARLSIGEDLFLVYSPEREDPGNANFRTDTIPKVVGGVTEDCLEVGLALYGHAIDQLVPVSSTRAAELTKLLENIHRAVNIGLVNEMKIVADRMGIDIFEVINAAATKPFGFTPYYPGPGLGGHCIPIDPFYLTWKAREYGLHTRFIELAGEVNQAMPAYVVAKLADALNRAGKPLAGSKILVLGIAYKKNVDDMRETPAAEIMEQIVEKGGSIAYADPHVPRFPPMRNYAFELTATPVTAETLAAQDAVVIVTDHDGFDWDLIRAHAQLIVDSRGVYREPFDTLVRA